MKACAKPRSVHSRFLFDSFFLLKEGWKAGQRQRNLTEWKGAIPTWEEGRQGNSTGILILGLWCNSGDRLLLQCPHPHWVIWVKSFHLPSPGKSLCDLGQLQWPVPQDSLRMNDGMPPKVSVRRKTEAKSRKLCSQVGEEPRPGVQSNPRYGGSPASPRLDGRGLQAGVWKPPQILGHLRKWSGQSLLEDKS